MRKARPRDSKREKGDWIDAQGVGSKTKNPRAAAAEKYKQML
jgi:hypothetical protein